MKYLVWIISSINVYLGLHYFLNVIHVLQSSKYSKKATLVFALAFLALGICGMYFSFFKKNYKLGLMLGFGPWVITLMLLVFNMLTSDYK